MSRTSTSKERSEVLEAVVIHMSENAGGPSLRAVKSFLGSCFPTIRISTATTPFRSVPAERRGPLASDLAAARVKDPEKREQSFEPMYGEIDYELRILDGDAKAGGVVYEGGKLARAFLGLINVGDLKTAHLVLTDRLVSTFSEEDLRHHLRTLVAGFPSIISLPGIIEAPAKPREYHVKKQSLEMMGASQLDLERLKREFRGRFIDYGDPAIPEVVKGLALQAIMFHLTLDPFCANENCRLFNAHWQEDLIRSQVKPDGICIKHRRRLQVLGRRPSIMWL